MLNSYVVLFMSTNSLSLTFESLHQARVVGTVDDAIHCIHVDLYPVESAVCFVTLIRLLGTYLLDSIICPLNTRTQI